MEVILKQDVANPGFADDLVKVKDGYARNYLIPQGYAELATPAKKKMLAETIKQRAFKAEKIRKEAEFLAGKIEGLEDDSNNVRHKRRGGLFKKSAKKGE